MAATASIQILPYEVPTSIEELPLIDNTLRIMKFLSFLLVHNWRRYAVLVSYITVNISQFLDLLISQESIDTIIRNAYIAVLFFNDNVRAVLLCLNRAKYERYLDEVRLLYVELMLYKDPVVVRMLARTTRNARLFAKVNLMLGIFSCVGFLIYPALSSVPVLPYGLYVPGIDKYQAPYYGIFYVLQILMTPVGCCMFIPFTNLVVALTMFAILMCKVLQRRVRNLSSNSSSLQEIRWCIEYQLKLFNYVNTLNQLTTYIYLVEFLTFGAMLCVILFLLIIVETIGQMIIICFYIIMIFSQSVALYYFANELFDQGLNVAIAAYSCCWFDFDVTIQKSIQLFILKSQRPCAILVGRIYPMNLQMLQALLRASYSYFMVLKRLYG